MGGGCRDCVVHRPQLVMRSPWQMWGEYPPSSPQGDGLELEYEMVLTKGDSFQTRHLLADEFGAAAARGKTLQGGLACIEIGGYIGGYGGLRRLIGV